MINSQDKYALYKAQKQCIRTVTSANQRTQTNPLYKELYSLWFLDMIKLELTKLGYKVSNRMLPTPLLYMFNTYGGEKTHKYPTRSKNTPNIQQHTNRLFNKSFMCQSLVEFMKIPGITRKASSIKSFVCQYKK